MCSHDLLDKFFYFVLHCIMCNVNINDNLHKRTRFSRKESNIYFNVAYLILYII